MRKKSAANFFLFREIDIVDKRFGGIIRIP